MQNRPAWTASAGLSYNIEWRWVEAVAAEIGNSISGNCAIYHIRATTPKNGRFMRQEWDVKFNSAIIGLPLFACIYRLRNCAISFGFL